MNTIRDVLDIKGHEVLAISPEATVASAVAEMCRAKVGALVVFDEEGAPGGILSERDLLVRVLLKQRAPATTKVKDVMTHEVVTIDPSCTVAGAMGVMTDACCRHIPVVDEGALVGLVSIGDLVRAATHDQATELDQIREYVEGKYPG